MNGPSDEEYAQLNAQHASSEIDQLRHRVDMFERAVRTMLEIPAVYLSPSFAPVLKEFGYEIISDKKLGAVLRRVAR